MVRIWESPVSARTEPEKVYTTKIPASLAARLRAEAQRHDRSVSGQIRHLIRIWAEKDGGRDDAAA
jgi:hypothetical protein